MVFRLPKTFLAEELINQEALAAYWNHQENVRNVYAQAQLAQIWFPFV